MCSWCKQLIRCPSFNASRGPLEEVCKFIDIKRWTRVTFQELCLCAHTRQYTERATQLSLQAKLDICICAITSHVLVEISYTQAHKDALPNHASLRSIELKFTLNCVHHSLTWFAECSRTLAAEHVDQRG